MEQHIPYKNATYFTKDKSILSKHYDLIIIGSGMGGMSCAGALALQGKKVLVLEQHFIPGGYTQNYARKGYTWDIGVHALGEIKPDKVKKWLFGDAVEFVTFGPPYDRFYYPGDVCVRYMNSKEDFKKSLKETFPNDAEAIDAYANLVDKVGKESEAYFALQSLPEGVHKIADKILGFFHKDWWLVTVYDAIKTVTNNEKLIAALTSQWGYYGNLPQDASFGLHAMMVRAFWNGASYPKGGSEVFAKHLLSTVQKSGGNTLVKAEVTNVIVENNKAVGVRLKDGSEFYAKKIISAIGAKNSINKLLPTSILQTNWAKEILNLPHSPPYLCLNMGFKGNIKEAGATSGSMWFYPSWEHKVCKWDVSNPNSSAPTFYMSFQSLKDPSYNPGPEMRHVGECITFVDWEPFEKWQTSRRGGRPPEYRDFKKQIEDRMLAELKKQVPDLMAMLDYYELATPLSSTFFTHATEGAIYGLESTPKRFACRKLRMKTPVKNFYLTGVDTTTVGVIGALFAGLLTAAIIDKRVYLKLV
ncbi:NAD(P)/FAD-dependent oxidoreductase [bacterium]|nr:NAD(P)/FAD-dependent oxidoreductase [bacterium]